MAQTSGFFNANLVDSLPDRTYDATDFAKYFSSFIGDGVFAHNLNEMKVATSSNNMTVTVKSGRGYCKGFWFESDADVDMLFSGNSGQSNPRWDAVVIRFDFTNRIASLATKTGTNAATYAAGRQYIYNNLSRNTSGNYELCLAIVKIPANASTYLIAKTDIYDVRSGNYCGWVTGLVDQLDTSTIVEQLQAEFEIWFEAMKGQLSTDAAGHLQLEIDVLSQYVAELMPDVIYEYDPENDDQASSSTDMVLSKNVLNYDELEIYCKLYANADNGTGAAQVFKILVPDTLADLRALNIRLSMSRDYGSSDYRTYDTDYDFSANNKMHATESVLRRFYTSGNDVVHTIRYESIATDMYDLRIVKIVACKKRNITPISFNSYNETQVDTISDSVTEVTV